MVIGANGSGKSNFIGAFSFLHEIREGRLNEYVRTAGGADQLLHFGSKVTKSIHLKVSFEQEVNQYSLQLIPTQDDSFVPGDESACFWDKARYPAGPYETGISSQEGGREAGISNPNLKQRTANWVRTRLGRWRLYHVHDTSASSPLRKTAKIHDNGYLRADGSNLPAFLYLLQEKYPNAYGLIRGTVKRVAPFFDDFLLRPDPLNEETIRLAWRHKNSDQYFGASSLRRHAAIHLLGNPLPSTNDAPSISDSC